MFVLFKLCLRLASSKANVKRIYNFVNKPETEFLYTQSFAFVLVSRNLLAKPVSFEHINTLYIFFNLSFIFIVLANVLYFLKII